MDKVTITLAGQEHTVEVRLSDLLAWETYAKANDLEPFSVWHMQVFQAYNAAKRSGVVDAQMPFAAFADQLDALPVKAVESNPTKKGRGGASSSKSR
jgi:hypothetical protein